LALEWIYSSENLDWEELSSLYRRHPLGDSSPEPSGSPGKEPFYVKLGFKRMATAMAIFENQARALDIGLVIEDAKEADE
jgi:hypothetical protein